MKFLGRGRYYGFEIDGNGRFLLGSYMVTHNTTVGVYLSIELGLKPLVICHLKEVRNQWEKAFNFCTGKKLCVQSLKGVGCKLE